MKITPLNKENMLKWIDELTPDEATLLQGLLADPEIKAAIKEVAESNTIGAEYKWTKSEYSARIHPLAGVVRSPRALRGIGAQAPLKSKNKNKQRKEKTA